MRGFNEAGAVMPRKDAACAYQPRLDGASMRPGLLCPGKARETDRLGISAKVASMRPGLLCPGKPAGEPGDWQPVSASMRPGLLCPGKQFVVKTGDDRLLSFNEAGAVMPRKVASSSFENRGICPASMRPGLL